MQHILGALREERGAGAVEFAIVAPVFLALLLGIAQLAVLSFANTGLKSAVSEGARFASLYPRPKNGDIINHVKSKRFGLDPEFATEPLITPGVDARGREFIDLRMDYFVPLDLGLYVYRSVVLEETRRVYFQTERSGASTAAPPPSAGDPPPPTSPTTSPAPPPATSPPAKPAAPPCKSKKKC